MSQAVKNGPLNPAWIDSVTSKDHDHNRLWHATNNQLGSHATDIAALKAQVAALQALISTK